VARLATLYRSPSHWQSRSGVPDSGDGVFCALTGQIQPFLPPEAGPEESATKVRVHLAGPL